MVLHSRLIPFPAGQKNFVSDMHVSGWSGMGRDGAGMGEQGGSRDAGKCSS